MQFFQLLKLELFLLPSPLSQISAILYDPLLHPQNIAVMKTRSHPLGVQFQPLDMADPDQLCSEVAAIIVQYPNTEGQLYDNIERLTRVAQQHNVSFPAIFGTLQEKECA